VLFAAVRATLDERIYEDVLLRTMGAGRKLLRRAQWVEFSALGLLAGILASAIAEIIAWILFSRVFDLAYRFHWEAWLATPFLGALAVGLAGYWNTRTVVRNSPMRVLREL
jgi:putative ABC transport system permease protein